MELKNRTVAVCAASLGEVVEKAVARSNQGVQRLRTDTIVEAVESAKRAGGPHERDAENRAEAVGTPKVGHPIATSVRIQSQTASRVIGVNASRHWTKLVHSCDLPSGCDLEHFTAPERTEERAGDAALCRRSIQIPVEPLNQSSVSRRGPVSVLCGCSREAVERGEGR